MEAWRQGGFGNIHAIIDDVRHNLQYGGDDVAATGATGDEHRLSIFEHECRCHRTERSLAWSDCIGIATDQAVGVRRLRFGREIVHLVVEQNTGACGDDAGTKTEVQRVGHGDGIAVPVDHRIVSGLATFVTLRLTGLDFRSRLGPTRIDARCQLSGVGFRSQASDRHFGEIGIA